MDGWVWEKKKIDEIGRSRCERDGLLMWKSALGLVQITQVAGQGCVKRLKWGTGHQ